jgi:hypothetical protein
MGDEKGSGEASVIVDNESRSNRDGHQQEMSFSTSNTPFHTSVALVTPSRDQHNRLSPPSARVVHHTDVRTKALGVKAELEELRSKQLAKSIRQDIGTCTFPCIHKCQKDSSHEQHLL